jgi:hypothetical protein
VEIEGISNGYIDLIVLISYKFRLLVVERKVRVGITLRISVLIVLKLYIIVEIVDG